MVSATTIAAVMTISNVVGATIAPRRLPSTVPLQLGFYRMLGTCAEIPTLAGFMIMVKAPKIGIQVDLRFEDYDGQVLFVSNYHLAPISMPVEPGEGSRASGESDSQCYALRRKRPFVNLVPREFLTYVSTRFPHLGMFDQKHFSICPGTEEGSASVKLRLKSGTDVGEQTAAIVFDHRIEGRSTVRGFELTNYVAAKVSRGGDVDEHTYARSYRDCYTLGERHGSDRLQSDASPIPASQDQSKVPARICAESKDLISLIYEKDDATETKVYLVRESTNLALLADTAARREYAPSLI
ncbi:hypothetical protein FOZ61_007967 [Perkinsus olseni]|uniref:Uncharacterized protein n=1 Tax=Perkinsus olseni TaxID=32597 RepID=A0A7J6L6W6_PEROL|nr:hypothetical protein FOZ61_007967 [Perkinsus olseni]